MPVVPRHIVRNCLAYRNRVMGFYANHHLGGITWINNTGYMNPSNFCMLNRLSADVVRDTTGYGHVLVRNLSLEPRDPGAHLIQINPERCVLADNSFDPFAATAEPTEADFVSLDPQELMAPRKADGSLPDVHFLQVRKESPLYGRGIGYQVE